MQTTLSRYLSYEMIYLSATDFTSLEKGSSWFMLSRVTEETYENH